MSDADRVAVKTYVPEAQKSEWREHADRLDMSQSEFLRTMVQAGRRGFLADREEGGSEGSTPGGDGLESRVLDRLDSETVVSWDQLIDDLSGDFEDRLYDTIQRLSEDGRIAHDPRENGYRLREDA